MGVVSRLALGEDVSRRMREMRYAGLFLATIVTSINSLNITDLVIPPYTQQGSNITLFCSYSVDKDKIAELDIKWYFGTPLPPLWCSSHICRQSPKWLTLSSGKSC